MKKVLTLTLALLMIAGSALAFSSCAGSAYNLPIVCGETGMNDICGVATYGVDYYNLGVQAGDMAADILLEGASAASMPVKGDPNPALSVNTKVAEDIGFKIPESVTAKVPADNTGAAKVTRVDSAISTGTADFTVGILQLVQHVALDQCNEGFIDQLSIRMSAKGKTVKIDNQNASNDQSNNTTISANFVAQKVNLIYAIATPSAQAAVTAAAESNIPVIFNAVTDPVDAGLVNDLNAPGKNVTGVSDMNPVAAQVDLIGELLGEKDVKIGFLYTSAEANSIIQVNLGVAECEAKGYAFVKKGIGDINDIQNAMIALKKEGVTAIYIPTDNTLANGAATIHSLNVGN